MKKMIKTFCFLFAISSVFLNNATASCVVANIGDCSFPTFTDNAVEVKEVQIYSDGGVWFIVGTAPSGKYFRLDAAAPATEVGMKNMVATLFAAQSTGALLRMKVSRVDPTDPNTYLVTALVLK